MDAEQNLDFLKMVDVMLVELVFRSLLTLAILSASLVIFYLSEVKSKFVNFFTHLFLIGCLANVVLSYRSLAAALGGHAALSYGVDWLNGGLFYFYILWLIALILLSLNLKTKKS